MKKRRQHEQFSIAGLLFVIAGLALCFVGVPYLYTHTATSPPWSVFPVVILMFAWCMIPLRQGATRVWWAGFVTFGAACLVVELAVSEHLVTLVFDAAWSVSEDPMTISRVAWDTIEVTTMFALVGVAALTLCVSGIIGGWLAAHVYSRIHAARER